MIALMVILSMISATLLIHAQTYNEQKVVYKVTFRSNEVGYIDNTDMIDVALKVASQRLEDQLDKVVLIDEMVMTQPKVSDGEELLDHIGLTEQLFNILAFNQDEFLVRAKALSIDDTTEIILQDEQAAEFVLSAVKSAYITPGNENNVQDVTFVESVEASEVYVSQDKIVDHTEAVQTLQSTTEEKITYKIQSGDTLSEVAQDNEMGLTELLKINPEITTTSLLQIGQELNLMIPKPMLSVVVTEAMSYDEAIEPPVEYQKNDKEYKDYRKTIQEGMAGLKKVTANIVKTNGLETGREVVSEEVLTEPTKTIVVVGTRTLPAFRLPVYGRLTSGYGPRWGSTHTGIDLAASTGTSVKASESGKVTFSGWGGGYGYLVKIQHADGFETYYAHNSRLYVKVGQKVNKGDTIAASGNTGNSTGPHVHFEIRRYGNSLNPFKYLN